MIPASVFAAVFATMTSAGMSGSMSAPLVVLPLGDSITEGVPTADGYRGQLARLLAPAGIQLRYVGSLRSPAGAHEGWSGYTSAELLPRARAVLARQRPDVVLLHIGTNDLGLGVPVAEAAANVRALLLVIDERSRAGGPGARPIRVLLASIVPRNLSAWGGGGSPAAAPSRGVRDPVRVPSLTDGVDPLVTAYNDRLSALAEERRRAGQPVDLVDQNAALDAEADLADALHPSERGYEKMARVWAAALRRHYAPQRQRPP